MNSILLDPVEVLARKEAYAIAELQKDTPLIALSSPKGVYLASYSGSNAHQKVRELCKYPGVAIVLGGVGNQSDLAVLKGQLRQFITAFEQLVHGKDLSGRLAATTVAAILRKQFLESPRPLCVRIVVVDPYDQENPICAIAFNGEEKVGRNLCIDGKGAHFITVRPDSVEKMKQFAKKYLKRPRYGRFQSYSFELPTRASEKNKKKKSKN